jgi:ferric-dicitrate binding protein FerR (iron transport regulator)
MSANPVRLKHLFDKYLQNACTEAELREFWELMGQLSENDLIHGDIKALWDKDPSPLHPAAGTDAEKLYRSVMEKAQAEQVNYLRRHRRQRSPVVMYIGMAASLLLLIFAGWWLTRTPAPVPAHTAQTAPPDSAAGPQHEVVRLPDGTIAILNRNSRLDFPPAFSGNAREVRLTGEAYFQVKKDDRKPFRVHAGSITTTVLGTTFNIKAYPADGNIAVTVTSGKVRVSDSRRTLAILEKNNRLVVNRQTGEAEKAQVNARPFVAWKQQELVFRNLTLAEVATALGYHFDAEIRFGNEQLARCRFTGSFPGGNELEQVLDVITAVTGSSWEQEGSVIIISGGACAGDAGH